MGNNKYTHHDNLGVRLNSLEQGDYDNIIELSKALLGVNIVVIAINSKSGFKILSPSNSELNNIRALNTLLKRSVQHYEILELSKIESGFEFFAGIPLLDNSGKIIGVYCVLGHQNISFDEKLKKTFRLLSFEISEKLQNSITCKKVKNELKEIYAENKEVGCARTVIEMMHDGLTIQNRAGELIMVNPAAYRILGINDVNKSKSSASDEHWKVTDEYGEELHWHEHPSMIALHQDKIITNAVIKICRPDTHEVWLNINAVPFEYNGFGKPTKVMASFADVTEHINSARNLKELSLNAEAANIAKSEFLANMSHEIRTPLNGVIGVADALLRTELSNQQIEMARIIESSSKILLALINDILDFSKIEAGKIEIENHPFNLYQAIDDISNLMRMKADEKGIDFTLNYSKALTQNYIGDIVRVKQIVTNLASNAVKFTYEGSVNIDVSALEDKSGVMIVVEDTGIGMDGEALAKLFSRFTQADGSITRQFGGTGLGLAITKSLVELLGGEISTASKAGEGTKFSVYLPLEIDNYYKDTLENSHNHHSNHSSNHALDILLVEDHLINQRVFEIMISHINPNLVIANNGIEAIDEFMTKKFDLIFMDMFMPIMDGITATSEIRKIEKSNNLKTTPIIMLTANASKEHEEASLKAGANMHLTKPTTINGITEAIAQVLNDHSEYQEQDKNLKKIN